jgi:hypothetical protein
MSTSERSLVDSDMRSALVRKIALKYFIPRYIIGNLPRAPVVQLDSPCHPWIAGKDGKYGAYTISNKLLDTTFKGKAHRLSYQLFNGPTGSLLVLHLCQEELCVNPNHLILGNQELNATHQLQNKKAPTNPHLKNVNDLTTDDVKMIRVLYYKHNYPIKILCDMYKKTHSCIYNIVTYKTWNI